MEIVLDEQYIEKAKQSGMKIVLDERYIEKAKQSSSPDW